MRLLDDSPVTTLGETLPLEDFEMRSRLSDQFVTALADNIRTMVSAVSMMHGDMIDSFLEGIPSMEDAHTRAMKSWHVVAWFNFFEPYAHPDRKHFIDLSKYIEYLKKDAEAYYMYAVFIIKEPSVEVYAALKNMHPEVARRYANHCKNLDVARYNLDDSLNWLFVW